MRALRVVHISLSDLIGGAARSAFALHRGLLAQGVDSRMLVGVNASKAPTVAGVLSDGPYLKRLLHRSIFKIQRALSLQYLLPWPPEFVLHPWVREADVIHLHNVHGGYCSHLWLPLLSRSRPVVWTFHDMWPFTGHCSYAYDCERWKTGCGACPILSEDPALRWDTTALHWRVKRWVYQRSRFVAVTPSRWLEHLARQSPLLAGMPIHRVPYAVDTAVFRQMAKPEARQQLALPMEGRIVLFAAQSVVDRRKGGDLLRRALPAAMPDDGRGGSPVLLVLGKGGQAWSASPIAGWSVRALDYTSNDERLAALLSAADVLAFPSRADNLPNVLLESLACGTPAVAFDVGGCGEIVRHLDTGYLAAPDDTEDFAHGLRLFLDDDALRARTTPRCRETAVREFTLDLQAQRYTALYHHLLASGETVPPLQRVGSPAQDDALIGMFQP